MASSLTEEYYKLLSEFMKNENEIALYQALEMGKNCVELGMGPEDIVGIHLDAVRRIMQSGTRYGREEEVLSLNFLLEIMVAFGISHKEFLSLKLREMELKKEMEIAREIQEGLLPKAIPEISGVEIGIEALPAKEMAGDYYDIFMVNETLLGLAIADVSGKSIPAALILPAFKYALRAESAGELDPAKTVNQVNRFVAENLTTAMFVSMFYALYKIDERKLTYVRAGHEPGILWRARERSFRYLEHEGVVLGVDPDYLYQVESVIIEPGDILVLYTDGVAESRAEDKSMYGVKRIKELIRTHEKETAASLAHIIEMDAANFANMELHDDITVIVLKITEEE